jgi:hypothetical protein
VRGDPVGHRLMHHAQLARNAPHVHAVGVEPQRLLVQGRVVSRSPWASAQGCRCACRSDTGAGAPGGAQALVLLRYVAERTTPWCSTSSQRASCRRGRRPEPAAPWPNCSVRAT